MIAPVICSPEDASSVATVAGDLLFVRGRGLLSHGIAWATKARWEPVTLATHQAMFAGPGEIVHAIAGGVRRQRWGDYADLCAAHGKQWAILQPVPALTATEREIVVKALAESVGWHYSWMELPLQLLDGLLAKCRLRQRTGMDRIVFRWLGDIWRYGVVCSGTANRPLIAAGLLPREYRFASPDDSWDYLYRRGASWRLAAFTPGWFRE